MWLFAQTDSEVEQRPINALLLSTMLKFDRECGSVWQKTSDIYLLLLSLDTDSRVPCVARASAKLRCCSRCIKHDWQHEVVGITEVTVLSGLPCLQVESFGLSPNTIYNSIIFTH